MGCVWISVPLAAPCANQRASDTACNAGRFERSPLLLLATKTNGKFMELFLDVVKNGAEAMD